MGSSFDSASVFCQRQTPNFSANHCYFKEVVATFHDETRDAAMKKYSGAMFSPLCVNAMRGRRALVFVPVTILGLFFLTGNSVAAPDDAKAQPKKEHLAALSAEKDARTPAQNKLDSHLLYGARKHRGESPVPGIETLQVDVPPMDEKGRVTVEIRANVTGAVLEAIEKHGGIVLQSYPQDRIITAAVPLQRLEKLAAHENVQFIQLPSPAQANTGVLDTEGDFTHGLVGITGARFRFGTDGTGVKVGVISTGVDSLATSKADGDIGANATVLSGQAGSGDEGTAMMEIVQDIAPGAQLFFATSGSSTAAMAQNIRDLKAAGCTVIIDDITFFTESPFQDGPVALAVNEVSAAGVLYFSSAANSGNKDSVDPKSAAPNTASTWEGDFVDSGAPPPFGTGQIHSFGTQNFNTNPNNTGPHRTRVDLFWNDPLGTPTSGANNDYDLIGTDDAGNILDLSANTQNGMAMQDPYEFIPVTDPSDGTGRRSSRIYIFKHTGAATRFLHLSTERDPLQFSTAGSTRGHNASGAANAFCVAAAAASTGSDKDDPAGPYPNLFTTASRFEPFTSDGPRRIFYQANGTAITPGNLTATGGQLLQKPDFTAADGVTTSVPLLVIPGLTAYRPFFGTSAAAPHAGAIAALLKAKYPAATAAQIRDALTTTALDIGAAGWDRDSGIGIVMPIPAMTKLGTPPTMIALVGSAGFNYPLNPNQPVQKTTSQTNVVTNVRVTGAPVGGGSVHLFSQDGTARCAAPFHEYDCVDQTINFPAGDSTTPVTLNIFPTSQDFFPSGDGTFTVNLNNPVHGTISTAQATITIVDTPTPNVTLSVADTAVVEGNPTAEVNGETIVLANFVVTLSAPSDRFINVNVATADGTAKATNDENTNDYIPVTGLVVFAPGETKKMVNVPVLHTPIKNEPEETFSLNLSNPVNTTISKSSGICTIHQPVTPGPAVNISTRMRVLTGNNVLIAGFIVTGTEPKKVIIRGIGPSLAGILPGALTDTTLELHQGAGTLATNDNWKINGQTQQSQEAEVRATTIPPSNDLESSIIATLNPGAYTAILAGKNGGQGIGVVEVYDLSLSSISQLANISTRGFVDAGDNVMIGGFIVGATTESGPTRLIVRALGPSLPLAGTLQDPTLELHDSSGTTVASNDNWKDTQEAEIRFTTIPPTDDREAAIVSTLNRGAYTAVVRGKGGTVGIALVEVYKVN
jgi:hypothetical protein